MKKIYGVICALLLTTGVAAQSHRTLFDDGWTFTRIINGQSSSIQSVNLPHDWDIYKGPHSGKGATGTGGGWFEAGKGEYRKTFSVKSGEMDL